MRLNGQTNIVQYYLEDKLWQQVFRLTQERRWNLEASPVPEVFAHCVHRALRNPRAAEEPHLCGCVNHRVAHRGGQGGEGVEGQCQREAWSEKESS